MSNVRRHQLELPVAPAALLFALVPTLALAGLAYWRFVLRRSFSSFSVVALGIGLALAALVVAVGSTYAFKPLWPLRASNWLVVAPLVTYLAVIAFVGVKDKLSFVPLCIVAVVGFAPLYLIGFYAWLLAACSFGDCL